MAVETLNGVEGMEHYTDYKVEVAYPDAMSYGQEVPQETEEEVVARLKTVRAELAEQWGVVGELTAAYNPDAYFLVGKADKRRELDSQIPGGK